MRAEKNNTFCPHPFKSMALKNFKNNKLDVAWPCCMMGNKTEKEENTDRLNISTGYVDLTPEEIFLHPRMDELRKNAVSGIRDSACKVCWDQEDKGMTSFRLNVTEEIDTSVAPELSELDYTASSVCNLRCRMCSPQASNSLLIDHNYFKKNNMIPDLLDASNGGWIGDNSASYNSLLQVSSESIQWKWMMENTHKIKNLKMAGGEPFHDKNVLRLIDTFIEKGHAKDTTLSFMTNGTLIDSDIIEKLNCFKGNSHNFSIDGWGKVYDYIRYPATFELIDKTLKNYLKNIKVHLGIHPTIVVSALNIFVIDEYTAWLRSMSDLTRARITIHFAEMYPFNRGTSLNALPVYLLKEALSRINHYDDPEVNNVKAMIADAIKNNKEDKKRMLGELTPFDLSRNQSFKDFLDPMLVEWLNAK